MSTSTGAWRLLHAGHIDQVARVGHREIGIYTWDALCAARRHRLPRAALASRRRQHCTTMVEERRGASTAREYLAHNKLQRLRNEPTVALHDCSMLGGRARAKMWPCPKALVAPAARMDTSTLIGSCRGPRITVDRAGRTARTRKGKGPGRAHAGMTSGDETEDGTLAGDAGHNAHVVGHTAVEEGLAGAYT